MSAYDQGEPVVISMYNQAKTPFNADLPSLAIALQTYIDAFVSPIWGTPAKINATSGPVAGTWSMVFLDDADAPGALAYHDEESGLPVSKVFVHTLAQAGDSVSSAASHELVEMLVDPAINLQCTGPDGSTIYPYEAADPVEANVFSVAGFPMSNFIYPSWFETFRPAGSTKFDHLGVLDAPFQLAPGGYASTFSNGKWGNIFGSEAKRTMFKLEDRRGHRTEYRRSVMKDWPWYRSLWHAARSL